MNTEKRRVFRCEIAVLVLLVLFLAAANIIWLNQDKNPPSWDQSAHLSYSLDFHRMVKAWHPFQDHFGRFLDRLLGVSTYWPPFFHFSTLSLTFIFGFSPNTVVWTHFLYMVLLAFSVYSIGKHFLNARLGAAAAALTLLYPIVFGLSRTALIDFPLTAMVAFVQALILKSRAGTRWRSAWLLGLAAGLCVMTKWTGPVFFAGTFLLVLVKSWKEKSSPRKAAVLSLLSAAAAAALIILPWFIKNGPEFVRMLRFINTADAARLGSPGPFSLRAFSWYGTELVRQLLTWPLFLFALLGLASLILWVKKKRFLAFMGCWAVLPFFVFAGVPVKDDRFIVPLLPALALLTVAGISSLPRKAFRLAVLSALFVAAFVQFSMVSFGWPRPLRYSFARPPSPDHWPVEEIVDGLEKRFGRRPMNVGFLPSLPYFNAPTFRYFVKVRDLPYTVVDVGMEPVTPEILDPCDILILKSANLTLPQTAQHRERFFRLLKRRGGRAFGYRDWKHFRLPDKTNAYVFVRDRLREPFP